MKKMLPVLLIAALFGCETEITPELNPAERILVVDAWLNQKLERQEIRITRSLPYFENALPTKISGAIMTVEDVDDGTQYQFQEGDSSYFWEPSGNPLGVIGHQYKLTLTVENETFEAYSRLGRVPPVDSIEFNYNPKDLIFDKPYYTAEFVATDPVGEGDTYWIRAWKNGVYLNKPGELNIAYDAGATPGQAVDGQQFILPIRRNLINPFDEVPGQQNGFYPPYGVDDSVYVEIHSIDPLTFDFWFGVFLQTDRPGGFAELFATPLANVITNVKSTNEQSVTKVAGFFNVAAVRGKGRRLTQETAQEAQQRAESN